MKKTPEIRVLVVEPNRDIADWMMPVLEDRGYGVDFCTQADEAVQRIRNNRYDLVLVHDEVEIWPGRDLVKEVVRVSPFTCCGVITDMDANEIHDRMESLGIVGHVGTKPDPETLNTLLDGFESIWKLTVPTAGSLAR
ncbi:MAG: response regulator [Deltaproteobacteria bacterium]|nr:response regulator [Deltaproteobacteria bacterium]